MPTSELPMPLPRVMAAPCQPMASPRPASGTMRLSWSTDVTALLSPRKRLCGNAAGSSARKTTKAHFPKREAGLRL
jgi:hypothetical protein